MDSNGNTVLRSIMLNTTDKKYYVYAWYRKSTNHIFHIGKGTGNRYLDTIHSRNKYFKAIINKYKDDVDVKLMYKNLYEKDAFDLERKLISEYKEHNECETNFHIGGCGGFPGNSEQRSKKISEFAKTRIGSKNPMFGKTHSINARKHISDANKGKKLTPEHIEKLRQLSIGRVKSPETLEKMRKAMLGKKLSKEQYIKMMNKDCKYKYEVVLNDALIYWCLGHTKLWKFCKEELSISRTIIEQVINRTWVPKFNRHKWLTTLEINVIDRSVSTNCDECSSVEWRLTPFEVRNNLNG